MSEQMEKNGGRWMEEADFSARLLCCGSGARWVMNDDTGADRPPPRPSSALRRERSEGLTELGDL